MQAGLCKKYKNKVRKLEKQIMIDNVDQYDTKQIIALTFNDERRLLNKAKADQLIKQFKKRRA